MDNYKTCEQYANNSKSNLAAYFFLFGGCLGTHHFYLHRWKSGLGMISLFVMAFIYPILMYEFLVFHVYHFPVWFFWILEVAFLFWIITDVIFLPRRVVAYNKKVLDRIKHNKPDAISKMSVANRLFGRFLLCMLWFFAVLTLKFLLIISLFSIYKLSREDKYVTLNVANITSASLSTPRIAEKNVIGDTTENKRAKPVNPIKKKMEVFTAQDGLYRIAVDVNKWHHQCSLPLEPRTALP